MTEPTSASAAIAGDDPRQPDTSHTGNTNPPTARPLDPLQLQAELLAVQECLDTLAHLMRHSLVQTASLNGIAALLDNLSSLVADVSLQLAA